MRTALRFGVVVLCAAALWLAGVMLSNAPSLSMQSQLPSDGGLAEHVRIYLAKLVAFDEAHRWGHPLGLVVGGVAADLLGGELVLIGCVALGAGLVLGVRAAPQSLLLAGVAAMVGGAFLPATCEVAVRTTRRWTGVLVVLALAACQSAETIFAATARNAFERGEWRSVALRCAAVVFACAACGGLVLALDARRRRAEGGPRPVEPYRDLPESKRPTSPTLRAAWRDALTSRSLGLVAAGALAAAGVASWLPRLVGRRLPLLDTPDAYRRVEWMGGLVAVVVCAVVLFASDLVSRHRAKVAAAALFVGVAIEARILESREVVVGELGRAISMNAFVPIVPALAITAAALSPRGAGLVAGLVLLADAVGQRVSRGLFFEDFAQYRFAESGSTYGYVLAAVAVVILVVARTPHARST